SSFKRNRTLLVITGVEVSLLGGIVDIARFMLRWDWLYPIGIPSNAVFALALGVAIVRYRLMDVGVLAKRIVLYLLTSAALAPIPVLDKALALWLGMTGRTLIVEETSFRGGAYTKMRAVVAQLEAERVALVVPLFMEGEVTAVLVVGEKLSGEIFDTDEIELLEMLAGETVIALKNAGLYQDLQSR